MRRTGLAGNGPDLTHFTSADFRNFTYRVLKKTRDLESRRKIGRLYARQNATDPYVVTCLVALRTALTSALSNVEGDLLPARRDALLKAVSQLIEEVRDAAAARRVIRTERVTRALEEHTGFFRHKDAKGLQFKPSQEELIALARCATVLWGDQIW